MLDKIVAGFLTSYLGEYFENIDTEQVKISLWGGNVNLKHLKVRKDALRMLDIPFCISQGVIVNLSVTIPWTKLQSESIVIRLTDVTLVVEEKGAAEYSVAQCLLDAVHRRRQELANAEEAMLSDFSARFAENQDAKATGNTEDDELSNTFSARLKATMLNNVKLEITNVRILYRAFSDKDNKLTEVILNIGEVTTYACDETYTPTFNSVKLKMLYKVLAIKGVSISLAKENVSKPYPMVKPFDLSVNVQYQPIPYDAQQPKFLVGILLNQVQTNVSSTQIRLLTATSRQLLGAYHREEKRLLRPQSCSPTSDPRAWWSYAIQCTILDLRLRHQSKTSSLSWKKFLDVKQKRDSYAALYARSRRSTLKATGWLETLTAVEEQQMKTLEEELPIETVKLARRIAVERVDLERKEYLKFKEQKQLQQQQQSPDAAAEVKKEEQPPEQKGWFSSWWSGSSAGSNVKSKIVEQLESETPEDQKQIKEMIGLVNAAHWGEAERLVIAKEFGLTAEEAKELEQQPLAAPQTLDSTVQWRVFFHYRSSTVDFFENDDPPREGERGFFTLLLSGFTVGVEIGPDGAATPGRD
ncbi:hypothetical protein AGDE_07072 [Angomonas deanei]|uniref:N-terminal region of Chorein or VPS13/Vacuolar sorting-associated protein 13, N-terminal, putative n=1 Tax=Angomonas deanei TaxID=59799 RepID=A0A7G2CAJ9_9TRYP|nr:hypothetical protein AGDE_07072 [Angomonas deanei]CAD2215783.1 N-terminal region of Chorein or VPS13/Vacuolar sorting-associated protein 13, N-terminal, putative [Angomonas deanei]|eukprot:EPY36121.1 hypothetical protein AGDE_07072 [Angomonas deanei]